MAFGLLFEIAVGNKDHRTPADSTKPVYPIQGPAILPKVVEKDFAAIDHQAAGVMQHDQIGAKRGFLIQTECCVQRPFSGKNLVGKPLLAGRMTKGDVERPLMVTVSGKVNAA